MEFEKHEETHQMDATSKETMIGSSPEDLRNEIETLEAITRSTKANQKNV